jgi:hypothetical protein
MSDQYVPDNFEVVPEGSLPKDPVTVSRGGPQGYVPDNMEVVTDVVKETDPAQHMLTDAHNAFSAAAQRTTPNTARHAENLVSDKAHVVDDGSIHYIDPQTGELMPTNKDKHVVLIDPEDKKYKVYARTEATNEGTASAIGRMLSPGMTAGNIQIAKSARDVVQPMASILGRAFGPERTATVESLPGALGAADRIGVDVPKAIATNNPLTKLAGQTLVAAPGGGPLQAAVKTSVGQLEDSVAEAARRAGGTVDRAEAGDNFANAIDKVFKPNVKSGIDAAYENLDMLMDVNKQTPLTQTREAVTKLYQERGDAALAGLGDASQFVLEAIHRPGMTFNGIKNLRSRIGAMLDKGNFPEGMDEGELRFIYKTLSGDLEGAAMNAGGQRAVDGLNRVNELNTNVSMWKKGLDKVLGPATRSGEGQTQILIRMAGTGAGADLATLAKARNAVPADVWADISSTAINQLGRGRNGEFSPTQFVTDFRKLSDRGKALLFRSAGNGDVLPYLNDIAEVSQKFADAGKLANTSRSAGHGAMITAGAGAAGGLATALLTAGSAVSFIPPLTAITALVGANGLARILAQPATAAAMARWSKVYHIAATTGSAAAKVGLEGATRQLAMAAQRNGVNLSPQELYRSTQGQPANEQQEAP